MIDTYCDPEWVCHPAVCAVGTNYHIILPVKSDMILWVVIGSQKFYDESNGVLRSAVRVHRVIVPMNVLDAAESYTVVYRKSIDRKPYFPKMGEPVAHEYSFRPVKKRENIHIYQLADTHGIVAESVAAAQYFGDALDLLILNGDIANHSGSIEHICLAYQIASIVTGGQIPVIFSRGNHDLRGAYAENLAEYTPNENGKSYYDFRVGCIWGYLLDCAEDKRDNHPEYGGTICCEPFRVRETADFCGKIADSSHAYAAPGVDYRLIISHIPFTHISDEEDSFGNRPFGIEVERYSQWAKVLRDTVHPQLILCGHVHEYFISMPGSEYDDIGQPCPVLVGSKPQHNADGSAYFVGMAITLNPKTAEICFTDSNGETLQRQVLQISE